MDIQRLKMADRVVQLSGHRAIAAVCLCEGVGDLIVAQAVDMKIVRPTVGERDYFRQGHYCRRGNSLSGPATKLTHLRLAMSWSPVTP